MKQVEILKSSYEEEDKPQWVGIFMRGVNPSIHHFSTLSD